MEYIDVVDPNGIPTGEVVERPKAHREGIRHRTSHVWLFRYREGKLQLLLQKRSSNKDSFPGCYDISSAGHIPSGDGFEESAIRELKEELGVAAREDQLIDCGIRCFRFERDFHGEHFVDHQVSKIYCMELDRTEESFCLQKEEVESVRWFDYDACRAMVKTGIPENCLVDSELEMVREGVAASNKN